MEPEAPQEEGHGATEDQVIDDDVVKSRSLRDELATVCAERDQLKREVVAANKIVAEQSAALGRAHAAKVYVVMGNDYPDAVFLDEKKAKEYCAVKKAKNKPGERIVYWRYYEFEVQT